MNNKFNTIWKIKAQNWLICFMPFYKKLLFILKESNHMFKVTIQSNQYMLLIDNQFLSN